MTSCIQDVRDVLELCEEMPGAQAITTPLLIGLDMLEGNPGDACTTAVCSILPGPGGGNPGKKIGKLPKIRPGNLGNVPIKSISPKNQKLINEGIKSMEKKNKKIKKAARDKGIAKKEPERRQQIIEQNPNKPHRKERGSTKDKHSGRKNKVKNNKDQSQAWRMNEDYSFREYVSNIETIDAQEMYQSRLLMKYNNNSKLLAGCSPQNVVNLPIDHVSVFYHTVRI